MAILGAVELLVTPEVLNQKAIEVERHVKNMKQIFNNMKMFIDKSNSYWKGEAGDRHRQNYVEQSDNIEKVLRRLGEHPIDLRSIAQTYTTMELKIKETIIQELPGDVI